MATKKFELLAKHVESLQFVIAIACWAVVIEKDQSNEKGLYSLLEKLYLGDVNDDDTIAMHESFYDGEGRFQYMYEDQKGENQKVNWYSQYSTTIAYLVIWEPFFCTNVSHQVIET